MTKSKESENKEMVKTDGTATVLNPEIAGMFDLKENMADADARLPQIGIIHQGQIFEMPDGSKQPEFSGIILDINKANAYWAESFSQSGGGSPPDCFSIDGVNPDSYVENPCNMSCSECENNKFGSDGNRGKKCKNMKRIHVLTEGSIIPFRLTLPPTSMEADDVYRMMLTASGIPYQLVNTKFSLKKSQNKEGIEYSEIVFTNTGVISEKKQAQYIKSMREQWLSVMRQQAVDSSEG